MSPIENLVIGSFPSPTVLITGATGRVGKTLAPVLATAGHRVCLVGRSNSVLQKIASELSPVAHGAHTIIAMDLEGTGSGSRVAEMAIDQIGRVTTFIHLACPPICDEQSGFDANYFESLMRVNVSAFVEIADKLLPHMLASQHGVLAGLLTEAMRPPGVDSWSSYAIAKTALMGALNVFAQRCRTTSVRTIGIAPGALDYQDNPIPYGFSRETQVRLNAEAFASSVRDDLVDPKSLANGHFRLFTASRNYSGLMATLVDPPSPQLPPPTKSVASSDRDAAENWGEDEVFFVLSDTFRRCLEIDEEIDIRTCGMNDVSRWDSIGHLKLMMEVEQAMQIKLATDAMSNIQTFRELETAVRSLIDSGY